MTEAEMIEAYVSSSEIAIAAMTFYLTIITGYLVVAHFAGPTLRRRQIVTVNAIFIVFALFTMWGTVAYFRTASYFWTQSAAYQLLRDEDLLSPHLVVGVVQFLTLLASLNYMWDIRRRPSPQTTESGNKAR